MTYKGYPKIRDTEANVHSTTKPSQVTFAHYQCSSNYMDNKTNPKTLQNSSAKSTTKPPKPSKTSKETLPYLLKKFSTLNPSATKKNYSTTLQNASSPAWEDKQAKPPQSPRKPSTTHTHTKTP